MTAQKQQIHAVVHGRVQGVSFRYYTRQTAERLGCTGWVRNRPDRTVECVVQGTRAQLYAMIDFLNRGSPSAHVERVDLQWQTPHDPPFSSFRIVY
jgi:acylphosphatase